MSNGLGKSKQIFLKRWIGFSFIGWLIGTFSVLWLGGLHQSHSTEIYNYSPFLENFVSMLVWLPLGIIVGAMQSIQLKTLRINSFSWVVSSACGWWVPVTIASLYFESGFYWVAPLFPILSILITGLSVGASHMYVLGKSFSKPKILLTSNLLGIVTLGFFTIWVFPMVSESSIFDATLIELYNYLSVDKLMFYRDFLAIISWIALPFIGTITTSLPSGILLVRFSANGLSANNEGSKISASGEVGNMPKAG